MKKILMVFLWILFVTGCTEVVNVVAPETADQTVNIQVNWSKLLNDTTTTTDSITHIGARLIYVKEGAVFIQSIPRTTTSTGLITLKVPPTDTAHLFVVAVRKAENTNYNKLIKLGMKLNISVPTNGTVNLTLDSLTMTNAAWEVDTTALRVLFGNTSYTRLSNDSLYNGRITTSKNDSILVLPIKVYDPFSSKNVHNTEGIITFYGGGSDLEDKQNWSGFGIWMKNPSVGVVNNTSEKFWPYLEGSMFNLPSGGYKIENEGKINVIWQ